MLGISGGQDSSLAGRLSQLAVESLRAETADDAYRFIAVRLPYGEQADEADAMLSINEFIKPDQTMRVNIKPAVDAMVAAVEQNGLQISDFNKGNVKARERMIAQYAIAGEFRGQSLVPIMPLKQLLAFTQNLAMAGLTSRHCHSWISARDASFWNI